MSSENNALVLFSGGQDSTTCLAWALSKFHRVETIGFDYYQRHYVEMTVRPSVLKKIRSLSATWNERLGEDHLIDLSLISKLSETALTSDKKIEMQENGLPNTFVPGRNLLFMIAAATLAYRRGLHILIGGMCETDSSGYPDCRDDTMRSLQQTLNLGMNAHFTIEMPLMWLSKKEAWDLARQLGGHDLVELIRKETHTCYLGERGHFHEWGHGCGHCPACQLRAQGYEQFIHQENNT